MEQTAEYLNSLTERIIGAAIEVHRMLGAGLLESAYEACLTSELRKRGLRVERQKPRPAVPTRAVGEFSNFAPRPAPTSVVE